MRDNFDKDTKDILARRVAHRCSNCRKPTSGPQQEPARAVNIGVAAHITAASSGGPRYDANLSSEERKSIQNGIWLCQSCAKLIDNDPLRYSQELLHQWKDEAERRTLLEIEGIIQPKAIPVAAFDLALEIYRLADRFRDEFKFIRSAAVFENEMEQLSEGENIFSARQRSTLQTMQQLHEASRKAKVGLDCGDQLEEKVNALRTLFNQDVINFALYFQLGSQADGYYNLGLSIPKAIEEPRMKFIDEIFGTGADRLYRSVDRLVNDMGQILRSYLHEA